MTFTTRPELVGRHGMVSSTHWLASATAMRVLELGGNAFDAVVAGGFALQVAQPHLNGIGGEVPIVFWSAEEGACRVLCAQGVAPASATITAFSERGLNLIPGTGMLAACVPGAFDGWLLLLRDYGTLRLRDVLVDAIELAENGVPVLPEISQTIAEVETLFRDEWPTSAELWLGQGMPQPGATLRNRTLAETYKRILREAEQTSHDRDEQIESARRAFYQGFIAEAIDAFVAQTEVLDASGRRSRGLLTGGDLARWSATYEPPVTLEFDGLTICKPGPWSQGPVFLQQLAILARSDIADLELGSEPYIHTIIEAAKLAFADREAWYGDPAYTDVPLDGLLASDYAELRAQMTGPEASLEMRPGRPDGRPPHLPRVAAAGLSSGAGEPTLRPSQSGDTCHIDVADRFGNMVAATPSGGWLQSSPAIPKLGFCLGTRAQMFWLDASHPNSLAPGKRPRTTLSPSFALRDGEAYMAFGTPGGDQQDQWALTFLLAHLKFGFNLQAAVDAPTFHSSHFPSSFFPRQASPGRLVLEGRTPETVLAGLRNRGHDVVIAGDWALGWVCAVVREPHGTLRAASSPRGMHAYAAGR
jgi:gamma-glutamyltranspeptidase/glutathione hydrolase